MLVDSGASKDEQVFAKPCLLIEFQLLFAEAFVIFDMPSLIDLHQIDQHLASITNAGDQLSKVTQVASQKGVEALHLFCDTCGAAVVFRIDNEDRYRPNAA